MKNARQQLDIINAYRELGSYRAAATVCGTTHRTVRRVVERVEQGLALGRKPRALRKNTDEVVRVIEERVKASDGRITAKRLLPVARAAGYQGSGRNLRRAVAQVKRGWRQKRRVYRPWLPTPGEHLIVDWTPVEFGLQMFCAVLAWSRYRFVRFARDQKLQTTLGLMAECLEELGGVPKVVLTDRMGCLKAGVVANVVVPHPDYVRLAAHYRFRPDFCEAWDPESKGKVENLAGYAQTDLVVPAGGFTDPEQGNRAAVLWGLEVNCKIHSETQAVPLERLQEERELLRELPSLRPALRRGEQRKVDRMQTVRFGSARYSVPTRYLAMVVEVRVEAGEVLVELDGDQIARHPLMVPGEASILDEHYPPGSARRPLRPLRIRTATEVSFLGLGPKAESFLRAAAAAGTCRLAGELAEIMSLEAIWGRDALLAALERATRFHRYRAEDLRAILVAGQGVANPVPPGQTLTLDLPKVPIRSLEAYAMEALR